MSLSNLQQIIESAWEKRADIGLSTTGDVRDAVHHVMDRLDSGQLRVAEPNPSAPHGWQVNEWTKKAVLLYFRLHDMALMEGGAAFNGKDSAWFDKLPSKFAGWNEDSYRKAGFRAVPGCWVRYSAYVAPDVVLMPSFINIGAYVGKGTMVDTWSTIGSCAQIGANCHISGGVGIGGVLEPLQAAPVIIEDDCFIGARSEVAEGVIIGRGAVISMGVFLGASTKIIDRATGEIFYGRVPEYAVVVPGSLPAKPLADGNPAPSLYCAVIVKRVDEKTRSKTSINELLRS